MPTYIRDGHEVTCEPGDAVDRRLSRLPSWTRTDVSDVPVPSVSDAPQTDDGLDLPAWITDDDR